MRLTKSRHVWLFGVLGGIANYFSINPDFLRIGVLGVFFLLDFNGLIPLYILMTIIMPSPDDVEDSDEYVPSRQNRKQLLGVILVVVGVYYLLRNTFGFSLRNLRVLLRSLEYAMYEAFPFLTSLREVLVAVLLIGVGFWLFNKERRR